MKTLVLDSSGSLEHSKSVASNTRDSLRSFTIQMYLSESTYFLNFCYVLPSNDVELLGLVITVVWTGFLLFNKTNTSLILPFPVQVPSPNVKTSRRLLCNQQLDCDTACVWWCLVQLPGDVRSRINWRLPIFNQIGLWCVDTSGVKKLT